MTAPAGGFLLLQLMAPNTGPGISRSVVSRGEFDRLEIPPLAECMTDDAAFESVVMTNPTRPFSALMGGVVETDRGHGAAHGVDGGDLGLPT